MKLAIYDAAENSFVGWSWAAGAKLYKASGYFQHVVPAKSWADGLRKVNDLTARYKINEIQFWGHGSPGRVSIAGQPLDVNGDHKILLTLLGRSLEPNSFVWLRTCASFAGGPGRTLASSLVKTLNCRVAGSTFNIGFPWHSGQHSVRPDALPAWPITEGLDAALKPKGSSKKAPHTVPFSAMSLPDAW
jgi:hypothetical protein